MSFDESSIDGPFIDTPSMDAPNNDVPKIDAPNNDAPSAAASTSSTKDGAAVSLPEAVRSTSCEILTGAASDPALTEDLALVLLKRSDLPARLLDQLSKNGNLMKGRKVKLALIENPRTPRHISIPMVRHLFTFDLMKVALTPAVPADIRTAAEEALINRFERLSQGERLSLARRASGRVAGRLLLDSEPRVIRAALANPRMTEAAIIGALMRRDPSEALVHAVCGDSKWSTRQEIRLALLRNEATPLDRALEFAGSLPMRWFWRSCAIRPCLRWRSNAW